MPPREPPPVQDLSDDPGLQPQRTALARRRTGLALAGAALVVALAWARLGAVVPAALALLVLAPAATVTGGRAAASGAWPALLLVTCAVAVLTALGVAAAVVGAGR